MRINKFLALATGMSRRAADRALGSGAVSVNGHTASVGQSVVGSEDILLHGKRLKLNNTAQQAPVIIMMNKPPGYVVSRNGQGHRTVYDLLPLTLHHMKPVGRLDKDSSGLLLLTNDGRLIYNLTHPSQEKDKVYEVTLEKPLLPQHSELIGRHGVMLDDGISKLHLHKLSGDNAWLVTMHEGRNRQIRRTFAALGYQIMSLHRIQIGSMTLDTSLKPGEFRQLPANFHFI